MLSAKRLNIRGNIMVIAASIRNKVVAARNLPITIEAMDNGLVKRSWSVLWRASSENSRIVRMGIRNKKNMIVLESTDWKLAFLVIRLTKTKKSPIRSNIKARKIYPIIWVK